uniref:RcpC/CpaB family pilus assembly protein n=2 Tax=Faecalibaculum rodentium TaxID=1702221 RepID=UPI0026020B73
AISVTVKAFANGLSGKLMNGDIVSVIAPDYRKQGVTVIPAELQYVEVIAVTANSGYDANTGEQTEDEDRELPGTVTLLVSPEQSRVLAELEADGKLHLSLVYRGTKENAGKFIEAQDELLAELYAPEEEDSEGEETEGEKPEAGEAEGTGDAADVKETQESSEQKEEGSNKTEDAANTEEQ